MKLEFDQARLNRDLQNGNTARANRDLEELQRDQWWLRVDRTGRLPGPLLPIHRSAQVGAGAIGPLQSVGQGDRSANANPMGRPAASAGGSVEIRNPLVSGVAVHYLIDGIRYTTNCGESQTLTVRPSSTIVYDRGGSFGVQQYALSAAVYELHASATGWALVKVGTTARDAERPAAGAPSR